MGRVFFENYGIRAKKLNDYTVIAGRYPIQKEAERRILLEVVEKLGIDSSDKCLEIGCGAGNILIPLSFIVKSITGIDHEACIEKLKGRISDLENIILLAGNFFDLTINEGYDKILIYGVLNTLSNRENVLEFIDKAGSLLNPGGKLLLGEIANTSKKNRFLNSPRGKKFQEEWSLRMEEGMRKDHSLSLNLPVDPEIVHIDDDVVLSIVSRMRRKGFDVFILPQAPELPFGHTREDILIEKPE